MDREAEDAESSAAIRQSVIMLSLSALKVALTVVAIYLTVEISDPTSTYILLPLMLVMLVVVLYGTGLRTRMLWRAIYG